jgi:hypothetical protein
LIVVGVVAYLVYSGSTREVVFDNDVHAANAATPLVPFDKVDHSVWQRLLRKYVDGNGMVDYAAWKAVAGDTDALKQYLAMLGRGDPEAPTAKEGKLAFWINAYNALTVYGILEVYPTSSIRNHTAKVLGYNIWRDLLLSVAGKKYSLEEIEHRILRKLGEPRIHFAIVCASIGCPRLRNEAYTPERLEQQLADNTRDFFSRSEHFRVDAANRFVYVSPILQWFAEDFGPNPQARVKRLEKYLPEDNRIHELIEQGEFSVAYLDYNWNLNDQRQKVAK